MTGVETCRAIHHDTSRVKVSRRRMERPYGGLVSASLSGLPLDLQRKINTYIPRQGVGRMVTVSTSTKKTSEERLRRVCEEPPSIGEIGRTGFFVRRRRAEQRVAFLDTSTDTLYVLVFQKMGIMELQSRSNKTVTPGLRNLGADETLEILEGVYRRNPGFVPSLYLLRKALEGRMGCQRASPSYLTDTVLSLVDRVCYPYLYPVVEMQFSELLALYTRHLQLAREVGSTLQPFTVPLVDGVEKRADIEDVKWRVLLLRCWLNPYEIKRAEEERTRTWMADLFLAASIGEMLVSFHTFLTGQRKV